MAQYYFHVRRGDQLETDEVGVELPDHEAAKDQARRAAGEMVRDACLLDHETLEVTDAQGEVILRFNCTDVKEVKG
jgi:hypothetical protein